MFGVRLVSKLWAILLMEVGFDAMNKEVCGVRMLEEARKYKLVQEEIFGEWNRTTDNGGLAKILFYNIACQLRIPAAITPALPPAVIIVTHMPWRCSSSNPLVLRTQLFWQCWRQYKK